MIELYFCTSPNVYKVVIALEELGLPYALKSVDLSKGAHFDPANLSGANTAKLPVIRDDEPADGGDPVVVFESGAILQYLAEKTGRLMPVDPRGRLTVMQWLFWQMAGLGPMAGQNGHFNVYAPEKVPYAMERYTKETSRLYGVLNKRLSDRPFVAGDYSIADMAAYPWIVPYETHKQNLDEFPHL